MGKRTERPLHGGGAPHQRRAFLCCLQHGWYFSRHTFWEHVCGLRAGSEVGRRPRMKGLGSVFRQPSHIHLHSLSQLLPASRMWFNPRSLAHSYFLHFLFLLCHGNEPCRAWIIMSPTKWCVRGGAECQLLAEASSVTCTEGKKSPVSFKFLRCSFCWFPSQNHLFPELFSWKLS